MNTWVFGYILGGLVFMGLLHASHNYEFSAMWSDDSVLVSESEGMSLMHILGEGCGCSEFVGEYLLKRGKQENEEIIAIGKVPEIEKLKALGFNVREFDREDPALSGIAGVPLFIVSHDRKVLYSGGYSDRMLTRQSKMQDLKIFANLSKGQKETALPIYGCANSKKLQNYFDPNL